MYPYPPWHRVVAWDRLVPQVLILAIIILSVSAYIWHTRKGRQRLVHLAIGVGIVIGAWLLLVPNIATGREAACRTQCKNNLKVIAQAVHQYHDEHGRLSPPRFAVDGAPPTSWRVNLLPYLSESFPNVGEIAANYDRTDAWDATANIPVSRTRAHLYICPSNGTPYDAQLRWYAAYAFLTGPGTAFPADGSLILDDITDGTSNTLLIVEACGRNIVWTEPRDVDVSRDALQINAPGQQPESSAGIVSSYHQQGAYCALADGSVRFLSQNMSPDVLRAVTTATGGEETPNF